MKGRERERNRRVRHILQRIFSCCRFFFSSVVLLCRDKQAEKEITDSELIDRKESKSQKNLPSRPYRKWVVAHPNPWGALSLRHIYNTHVQIHKGINMWIFRFFFLFFYIILLMGKLFDFISRAFSFLYVPAHIQHAYSFYFLLTLGFILYRSPLQPFLYTSKGSRKENLIHPRSDCLHMHTCTCTFFYTLRRYATW